MEKLIPDVEPGSKHNEQYYRRKLQAWCKILKNRQGIGHRERHSFVNWCYSQAKNVDELRPSDLLYLQNVCRLKHQQISNGELKRAKVYEQLIGFWRDLTIPPNLTLTYEPIVHDCSCMRQSCVDVRKKGRAIAP